MISNAAYLPPPYRPPHDARRLPLNGKAGWHSGRLSDVMETADGVLSLAILPGTVRYLNEAGGSLGGLVLPSLMAYTPDCGLLLLDRENAILKRFDPCDCQFNQVPCTGGMGSKPRQLSSPGGIAICGDNLLIADTGNLRLSVFSMHGYLLRGFWVPPENQVSRPWSPVDVAISHNNRVLVADPANGSVHIFNFGGCWLNAIHGVGAVSHLAVDCCNRLYVVVDENLPVTIYHLPNGEKVAEETQVAKAVDYFPPLSVEVNSAGEVNLASLCARQVDAVWFNGSGEKVTPAKIAAEFFTSGTYISEPLDSHLYRCQWDRLTLVADMPKGARITVLSYTAETKLTQAQIDALPNDAWTTRQIVFPTGQDCVEWDCLIRSEPGRLLWLKLIFAGDGATGPSLCKLVLDFPRISLRRYLPAVFGEEPISADFTDRFLAVFDRGQRQIETRLDFIARFFDPLSAPADAGKSDFLSWLASWIGVTLDRQLPLTKRRRLVKDAGKLFQCRGTLAGLRKMLELFLGFEAYHCPPLSHCGPCTTEAPPTWQPPQIILEHFRLRRWLFLGSGRLGDQARLWGQKIVNRSQLSGPQTGGNAQLGVTQLNTTQDPLRDPFHVYAHKFTIFLPACWGRLVNYQKSIERLIAAEKPAHTEHQIVYVEPRFRVGVQSMIGFDSVIACYPQGITLDEARLGKATVLSERDRLDSTLRVGQKARIGSTTRLK